MKLPFIHIIPFLLLLISLFLFSASCEKPGIDPSPVYADSIYVPKLVWKSVIYNDTSGAFCIYPKLTDEYFIVFPYVPYGNGKTIGIGVYNRETGARHPAWQNEPDINFSGLMDDFEICGDNQDIIVFSGNTHISAYSLSTAELLWEKSRGTNQDFIHKITVFGNVVFLGIEHTGDQWGKLFAVDAQTGAEKLIYHENISEGYKFNLLPPEVYIEPSGDTLLLFQKRGWNFPASDGRVDVLAYNMTQDSLKWRINDITLDGNSSVEESIVHDDYFYFQGANSIHCIDIPTGEIVWEDVLNYESFFQAQNLLSHGRLYMLSESGNAFCYDALSGTQLWKSVIDANPGQVGNVIAYYDGKLYLNTIPTSTDYELERSFRCLDASTGEVLWSSDYHSPIYGMCVDEPNGMMYGCGSQFAYKIDLKNSPVKILRPKPKY